MQCPRDDGEVLKALVVSIGNLYMRDDGVGQAIMETLRRRSVKADLIDLGTDIMRISLYGEGYDDIIILDSLRGGGTPGEVLSFSGPRLDRDLDSRIRSAHMMGSIEALQVLRSVNPAFDRTVFHMVGIVAKDISTGEGLSLEVGSSVEIAADRVEKILLRR
jgi:hydrogenase maturation protease